MTPETKVKAKISKILKEFGVLYFMPRGTTFGKSGVSDYICLYEGYFISIEAKSGKNKPTSLQEIWLAQVKEHGGISLVVNEDNIQDIVTVLTSLKDKSKEI